MLNNLIVQIYFSLFLLLCSNLSSVEGNFNFYLSSEEMKRILGLSKELYYVREGVVNEYALNFIVTIPAHINALHFTWQALGQKPLPYVSTLENSHSLAMLKPSLNITKSGLIPVEQQTFQISLPCTGERSDEIQIKFVLKVTYFISFKIVNNTVTLRRKKICLEDPSFRSMSEPRFSSDSSSPPPLVLLKNNEDKNEKEWFAKNKSVSVEENDLVLISTEDEEVEVFPKDYYWILISVGSSVSLIAFFIIILSLFVVFVRTRKVGSVGAESTDFLHINTSANVSSGFAGSLLFRPESPNHYSSISIYQNSDAYIYSSPHPTNSNTNIYYSDMSSFNKYKSNKTDTNASTMYLTSYKLIDEMTIPRCKVRLQSIIMEGSFARIYNGTVLDKNNLEKKVVVKTVVGQSSAVQMALLLHEGLSLVGLVDEHVWNVIGVAAEERVPPFLIYHDEGFRNLKRFLQCCRTGPASLIMTQEIVALAVQIANGITFLHRQNVVHRDVATRNCVINDELRVKVCDSGLSKDLFPEDYHSMGNAGIQSIKWMSPETILHSSASPQTDMWSFGVLLWELATLALEPYAEIESLELLSFLKMGYRLSQPPSCSHALYSSMKKCWTWRSDDRPKWINIVSELQTHNDELTMLM